MIYKSILVTIIYQKYVFLWNKSKLKKMKNTFKTLTLTALVAIITLSFTKIVTEKKEIKIENSQVVWKGYKVTGSHEGTILLKSGYLSFQENILIGGEFEIDMTTINTTDLEGEYKGKLEGHLKSDDFFGVENFPSATLVFTNVAPKGKNSYNVVGEFPRTD